MKQKLLLITLLCCGFLYNAAKANETEPNNTKAQANTLALNGSNSGTIGTATDVDWYKVTTNADGRLDLTLNVSNSLNAWFAIYDNDGTTLISQNYTAGTYSYSVDGLAAGTYYIKIFPYYSGQMPAYTISDKLVKLTEANDTEPDSTRGQALTLALNGSATGHIGYYYKNHRDTLDEYKLTTNKDGVINLALSVPNNTNVWCELDDNDGKTLLQRSYTAGSTNFNTDGLAAGTYYIKIYCYYSGQFAPYTITNMLTTPAQANDAEPDSTKAQAISLTPNTIKTGHIGYYYNNHRDTLDIYKITTAEDGNLYLKLTSANSTNVWFNLYDNNGTTLLHQDYTAGTYSYNVDGLAKGTYYLKVFCYYNSQFAPYTITDTLTKYNAVDHEPNKYAKQATTLLSGVSNGGHVGFYYDNKRDTLDWVKINYTGPNNGNMTLTFKLLPRISDGGLDNTWIQVYKDSSTSPLFSNYYASTSQTITLKGLSQGYYYIKVFEYYNSQFQAYSITPTFTQKRIADINIVSYDTVATCSNSIKYQPTNSAGPTKVQLYRFGLPYDHAVVVDKGKTIKFDSLPAGIYYATVYADGATGKAFSTSDTTVFEPIPTGLKTNTIQKTSARLNWNTEDCADYFIVRYKEKGTSTWKTKQTTGNVNFLKVSSLKAATTYQWQVATANSANGLKAQSNFSDIATFTTSESLIANSENSEEDLSINNIAGVNGLSVSPNPATSYFVIHLNDVKTKVSASVYDENGKIVWTSGLINAAALNGKQVNTSQLAKGICYLKLINENGGLIGSIKIIIAK